ncbi:hypothetical protein ONS95_002171 [Cadophora gregata]|uniref:uncharacterized protein n=1 Tax=Cadophora gregata TaxID=51156 RepID=UPI0026DD7FCA|nr:uncharacterized protein ONS95_002171 [Cadophora gregata]KAK0109479.1 hypothetical protein ONS95_002171 [Cadophora gregata]
MSLNAGILANTGFVQQFGTANNAKGKKVLASNVIAAWGSILLVGQVVANVAVPFLSAQFGRKAAMFTCWLILTASVICESFSQAWPHWLAGMGLGCIQVTLPAYITETAPTGVRGMVLMTYNLWWTVGTFFAGVDDFNLDQQVQVLVLLAEHEAKVAALQKHEKWYAIFRGTDGFRTLLALWKLLSQQFTGLVLFSTFGAYFFQQAGVGDPFQIKYITLSVKIVAAVVVVFLADILGNRMISCSGTTTMWATSLIVGILGLVPRVPAVNYIFVLVAVIWNIGLTMNGATGWGFIGEISSQRLRHYTSGAAATAISITNIGMNQLVPHMVNASDWNWGLKSGFFYAGVGLPFIVGMWLLIPETSGQDTSLKRSAAELDELFERKIRPWRFKKTETAT